MLLLYAICATIASIVMGVITGIASLIRYAYHMLFD